MTYKFFAGAVALVFAAGCASNNLDSSYTDAQPKKLDTNRSNPGNNYINCSKGSIERAVIDIGSTGPELEIFCAIDTGYKNSFNGYKKNPLESLENLGVPKENYKFDAKFKTVLEQFPSKVGIHTDNGTDICQDDDTYFPKLKKIIDFASEETNGEEIRAAATAAFRNSPNGPAYIRQLIKCADNEKLNLKLISQHLEGELEFRGVVAEVGEEKVMELAVPIVLGHGSTSFQVTIFDKRKPKTVQALNMIDAGDGSQLFCDWILSERNDANPECSKDRISHYPIEPDERSFAKRKEKFVKKQISRNLRKLIRNGNGHAFAIGGSQRHIAIDKPLKKPSYSIGVLRDAVKNTLGKKPEDLQNIPGFDPDENPHEHAVTNLLLTEGVMEGLGIASVEYIDASLADGLAVIDHW